MHLLTYKYLSALNKNPILTQSNLFNFDICLQMSFYPHIPSPESRKKNEWGEEKKIIHTTEGKKISKTTNNK